MWYKNLQKLAILPALLLLSFQCNTRDVVHFGLGSCMQLFQNETVVPAISKKNLDQFNLYCQADDTSGLILNKVIYGSYNTYISACFHCIPQEYLPRVKSNKKVQILHERTCSIAKDNFYNLILLKSSDKYVFRIVFMELKYSDMICVDHVADDSSLLMKLYISNDYVKQRFSDCKN